MTHIRQYPECSRLPDPDAEAGYEKFLKADDKASRTHPHYEALRHFRNSLAHLIDYPVAGAHRFPDEKSAEQARLDVVHMVRAAHDAKTRLIEVGYAVPDSWLLADISYGFSLPMQDDKTGDWIITISESSEPETMRRAMLEANVAMARIRHAPDASPKPAAPSLPANAAKPAGKRGRRKLSVKESDRRLAILDRWQHASEAGVTREKFCDDEGITRKQLQNFQDWQRQRENRQ